MKMDAILVPLDFSTDAEHALDYAIKLAQRFESRLLLHHVVYMYLPGSAEASFAAYMNYVRTDADEQLSGRRNRVEEARLTADTFVDVGLPAEKIVKLAREKQVDLIVMGTHGRTGLSHMLIGSVAERVVRFAPCPVMVVHKEPSQ